MRMNRRNSSNADSQMIASDVDLSQRNNDVKLKDSYNNEKYVTNIIDFLIKTLTLEKKKNQDHSWKKVILKLIQRL